jgi:hypothetical protein
VLDGPTQARPGPGSAAGRSVSGSATGLAPLARGVGGDLFHNFLDEPRGLDFFESGDGAAHASVTLVAFLTRVRVSDTCLRDARCDPHGWAQGPRVPGDHFSGLTGPMMQYDPSVSPSSCAAHEFQNREMVEGSRRGARRNGTSAGMDIDNSATGSGETSCGQGGKSGLTLIGWPW